MGEFDLFWLDVTTFLAGVGGCGYLCPFIGWLGVVVGGYDLFLAGYGWVWVSVTFFWLGMGECDLFLGWMWLGVGVSE